MSEQTAIPQFLYRTDTIYALFKQRRTDCVLRARRCDGRADHPHTQVQTAHDACAPGQAAYRMSFWMSLEIALRETPDPYDASRYPVLQRVRADHAFFKGMHSGEDQHLKGKALLFWCTDTICPKNPEWSPGGIPHADIEVLYPDGRWGSVDGYGILRSTEPSERIYSYPDGSGRGVVRINITTDASKRQTVLIRERQAVASALGMPDRIAGIVACEADHLAETAHGARWIYVLEGAGRLHAEELRPTFFDDRGLAQRLLAKCGVRSAKRRWRPLIDAKTEPVADSELDFLYRSIRLEDLLGNATGLAKRMWTWPETIEPAP